LKEREVSQDLGTDEVIILKYFVKKGIGECRAGSCDSIEG
jgi:hypothetical protein